MGGQTQGVGAWWGGTWKFPKLSQTHRWLSVGGGGVCGLGNDGGGEGGWGEALIEVLEQNRYRYFRLGCWNACSKTKSERNRGDFPILRESPL